MLILAASLFFAHPTPLDMPRAEAYLVREGGVRRLEDRFNTLDLWTSRAVLGRWEDVTVLNWLAAILAAGGGALFDNLPLLFAVGAGIVISRAAPLTVKVFVIVPAAAPADQSAGVVAYSQPVFGVTTTTTA